jgi:acyl carrier protein
VNISNGTIIEMLYECIDELNEQLTNEQKLVKAPNTPLVGGIGGLDSLGFINLIALIEERCESRFGKSVMLTGVSEKQMTKDPFQTVEILAGYIELALTNRLALWQ